MAEKRQKESIKKIAQYDDDPIYRGLKVSTLEACFLGCIRRNNMETGPSRIFIPEPYFQYTLPNDKHPFDFYFAELNLLVEIHGGTWSNGSHARGWGIERDCKKMAAGVLAGHRYLAFTGTMVRDNSAIEILRKLVEKEKTKNGQDR